MAELSLYLISQDENKLKDDQPLFMGTWCRKPESVRVRRLGFAHRVAKGVVLASFNAG